MKTTLTTILILLTLTGFSQTLLLQNRKARIKQDMHLYSEWQRTVTALDYIEYQCQNTAIAYRFTEDTRHEFTGRWICTEIYKTMPIDCKLLYVQRGYNDQCWREIAPDMWIFYADEFTGYIQVQAIDAAETVTFVFKLM